MVTIELREPAQLSKNSLNPVSGFVTFDFDIDIVAAIKARPLRKYDPKTKVWEIPYRDVAATAQALCLYADVEINGEYITNDSAKASLPKGFEFKTEPYAHQVDMLLFGLEKKSFLLGDDQGCGKTKQVIDFFRLLKMQGLAKRCLVICCVNGNKYNWEEEVATHSDCKAWILGTRFGKKGKRFIGNSQERLDDLFSLPEDVEFVITNVETLRLLPERKGNRTAFPVAERLRDLCGMGEFGVVAVDETHKNKNPDSQQSKAVMRLSLPDQYKIPMSGTYVLNSPFDLYWPLKFAGYEDHSWYQFKNYYGRFAGFTLTGYRHLDELQQTLEPIMLRRLKTDVADLPEKIEVTEYVEMSKAQASIYGAVRNDILREIDRIRLTNNPLSQLIRLRQATGYPGILSTVCQESAKIDRMVELVEDEVNKNGRVIIFSQWAQITEEAKNRLKAYNPAYITGDIKQEARFEIMQQFQSGKTKVCVGTIGAMGTGFTLNTATMVIFLDEPWNRALKDQAADRAHRIGTKYPVTVVTLITKDTIDERINSIVHKKGAMSDFLLGDAPDARSYLNELLDI